MNAVVVVINESTVVDDVMAWRIAWSLDYQVRFHFGPRWKVGAQVRWLPKGAPIPVGSWIIHLLDTSDQKGALAYHDEDGTEVPFARVFCKDTIDAGDEPSEAASHELLELLIDPHINFTSLQPTGMLLYAVEVCDPCQGFGYGVGRKGEQLQVADFVLPSYFDPNTDASQPTDYRGALQGPFSLAAQGYVSYVDLNNLQAGWQQQLGRQRTAAPAMGDRVSRILAKTVPSAPTQ